MTQETETPSTDGSPSNVIPFPDRGGRRVDFYEDFFGVSGFPNYWEAGASFYDDNDIRPPATLLRPDCQDALTRWSAARLRETSTYQGLITLAAFLLWSVATPTDGNEILAVGWAITGLCGVLLPDRLGGEGS